MTMVNVARQFSSSPPASDISSNQRSIYLNTSTERLLNNNTKTQIESPLFSDTASTSRRDFCRTSRSRSTSPSKELTDKKIQFETDSSLPSNKIERMTAEHIQRHLQQQFRPQQNLLLLPPPRSESTNMQPLFKNENVDGRMSKENKSNTLSSNGNTLKSAFSIRSLLSGGVDSKDVVAGQITNEFSHHLSRLAAPFGHLYPSKQLEKDFNESRDAKENSNSNEEFVDVDGGLLEDEEEEDIDLEEDDSLDNNEGSKCGDENVSDDGKDTPSSSHDGKKSNEKEENLTPEEKEKVSKIFIMSGCCVFRIISLNIIGFTAIKNYYLISVGRKETK